MNDLTIEDKDSWFLIATPEQKKQIKYSECLENYYDTKDKTYKLTYRIVGD